MSDLRFQQAAIYDRLKENDKIIRDANGAIGSRATLVATSSTTVAGLMGAAQLLPSNGVGSPFEAISLLLVFIAALTVQFQVAAIWKDSANALAGDVLAKPQELWDEYISQEVDKTYDNMLIDLQRAAEINVEKNLSKFAALQRAIHLFMVQLVLLFCSAVWPYLQTVI